MKISLYIIVTIILRSLCAQIKIEDHVNLISNIHDFYKPSAVIFINFADRKSMTEINAVFEIILMLSRKNIRALAINYEKIPDIKLYYDGLKTERLPMSVFFLTSKKAFKEFEKFSGILYLHRTVNLVIFQEIVEKPLKDLCLKPIGNSLQLKIDTLLIVKCYEENVLRQWYSIYGNQTNLYDWASWDSKTGLLLKRNGTFYTRRANLYGKKLRVATVKGSSMSHFKNRLLFGFYGDLLRILEKALNFTSNFVKEEPAYGSFDEVNGNWSGAIGLAIRKEVDLVATDFQMTSQRSEVIDYSVPLFFKRTVLYMRTPSATMEINWTAHFQPFNKKCWSALILFTLIISILITCIEETVAGSSDKLSRFLNNYFNTLYIYFQQGLAENPTKLSFRLIYFSLLCSAFFIISVYSASLVSTFAIPKTYLPFKSLEGFVNDGSYKLIIIRNSAYSDLFDNADDLIMRQMRKLLINEKAQPRTIQEGFDMVCRRKVAFYANELAAEIEEMNIACKLSKIMTGRYESVAMVLQKDSQYTELIKYQLTRLKDNGVLDYLKSKYLSDKFTHATAYKLQKFNSVDIKGVVLLLAIATGGAILGMIICFGERTYFSYKHEDKKRPEKKEDFYTRLSESQKKIHEFSKMIQK